MARTFGFLTKREWRLRWLSCIQCYSDTEAQKRWPDPEDTNEHYSYVECAASYFLDCGLADGYASAVRVGYVSTEEASAVAEFDRRARDYEAPGRNREDPVITADKNWSLVVAAAQEAKHRLLPILSDADEIRAISEPPAWEEDSLGYRCDFLGRRYETPKMEQGPIAKLARLIFR